MILATFSSLLLLLLLLFKRQLPDGKTPWQWRTEKHQNCTPKLPNVTSETHRKWWFSYFFLPSAAAAHSVQRTARMGKHHGSEGRRSIKIAPQNSLTWLLKPIENGDFSYFFFIENCDFSYFFLLLLLLLLFKRQLPDGKTPWQWRTEKHQNCIPKLPNVTSETHRKWWF